MFVKIFWVQGPQGYVHIYDHNIQTSFSLKPLGHSKPTLFGASLARGNESLYKWSMSYDQDFETWYEASRNEDLQNLYKS